MLPRANCWSALVSAAVVCAATSWAAAVPILGEWDFDSETPGTYPSGWSYSGPATDTYVQTGIPGTPSPPNVFQNQHDQEATVSAANFIPFSYSAALPDVHVRYDLYVTPLLDGSTGYQTFLTSPLSGHIVGHVRFFASGSGFTIFDPYAGITGASGGFTPATNVPYNTWHTLEFVFDAVDTQTVVAETYLNGLLINTESYTMSLAATQGVDRLLVQSVAGGSASSTVIYLDNVQVAIPEPTSAAMLGVGAAMLVCSRRRAR